MLQTVEAVIEPDGRIHLLERIRLEGRRRVLVTILDEPAPLSAEEVTVMSEPALAEDWLKPEEDAAWSHLQPKA